VHAIAESTAAARDDGVSSTPTILVGAAAARSSVQLRGLEGVAPAIESALARK